MKLIESRLTISYSELAAISELTDLESLMKGRSKSTISKAEFKNWTFRIFSTKKSIILFTKSRLIVQYFEDSNSDGSDEKSTYIYDPKI